MKTIRWGLLSTAHINRRIIPAIRTSKRGMLAAVASRDQARADAYAKEWEIPLAFGSYEAMLQSGEVDVVYVSLPNHLHSEWSVRALEAGKHVLCEKPFALTVEQVDRVSQASHESGCLVAEAFMYRHHPQTRILGEWIASGRLGDVTLVKSFFGFKISDRNNVRLVPEFGGGSLWDVGVYPVSLAEFAMGKEAPIWASGCQWVGSSGVDEDFAGLLCFSGNRAAQIGSSFRTPYATSAEVIGTLGRMVLTRPFNALDSKEREMVYYPENGKPQRIRVPSVALYSGEVEDMHDAILEGRPNLISLAESRNHVKAAQALYHSAQTGETVWLSTIG